MRLKISGRGLTLAGSAFFVVTVVDGYLLDRASYADSLSLISKSLELLLAPLFLSSAVMFVMGCVLLVRREDSRTCFRFAGALAGVFAAEVCLMLVGLITINVHDWTAMMALPLVLSLPLALGFAIVAEYKKA